MNENQQKNKHTKHLTEQKFINLDTEKEKEIHFNQ